MKLKIAVVSAVLAAVVAYAPLAFSTVEIGKKEAKPCAGCHTKAGDKALNDVGTCYKDKKSFDACKK